MQARRRPERSGGRRRGCIYAAENPPPEVEVVRFSLIAPSAHCAPSSCLEKKQIIHRLPPRFVLSILADFNNGNLDASAAARHLGIGKSRLYELRSDYLSSRKSYQSKASGGGHRRVWPEKVRAFLQDFLPLQNPPNYQLVADELQRLCDFKRARSCVEVHVKTHFSHLVPAAVRKNRAYRRFRRAHIGELYQHDSSVANR